MFTNGLFYSIIWVDSGQLWGKVGDFMFMGEYHHNIDEKGRIVLPLKLRCIEMDKVVVTRGLEQCLYLYTMEEWNKFVSKLNTLPFNKKDARTITRLFFSSASIWGTASPTERPRKR